MSRLVYQTKEELDTGLCSFCEAEPGVRGGANGPVSCEGNWCGDSYTKYKESVIEDYLNEVEELEEGLSKIQNPIKVQRNHRGKLQCVLRDGRILNINLSIMNYLILKNGLLDKDKNRVFLDRLLIDEDLKSGYSLFLRR